MSTRWGRWCLPSFNRHCDQFLKGHWADLDNSLCTMTQAKTSKRPPPPLKREEIVAWENPTLLTFVDTYGF